MFTAADLAAACGGVWHNCPNVDFTGIETDSRKDLTGKLFLALSGEKFDGHDFALQAINSGAAAICANIAKKAYLPSDIPVLWVEDTLCAYQDIARFHRLRFPELTVIAVTGSVGKTSVKEMLYAVCSAASSPEEVLATCGNTNNQIGVPQNLLRLEKHHRFAVIEMGTSSPGEIEPLSRTALPQVAVVNSIAPCHLEKLNDLAGVAREKGAIYQALPPDGVAVMPYDSAQRQILENCAGTKKIVTFGSGSSADVFSVFKSGGISGCRFQLNIDGKSFEIDLPLSGRHQVLNAAAAACAAAAAGIEPGIIAGGLPQTRLPGMRDKITKSGMVTLINDAYNANPVSMKAVLSALAESETSDRIILVLGTMRELGELSDSAHHEILNFARNLFPRALIITVGQGFAGLQKSDRHFDLSSDAQDLVSSFFSGDEPVTILVKGSRGEALEMALPEFCR